MHWLFAMPKGPFVLTTGALIETVPLLVSVTGCGALVVPATKLPKLIFFGDTVTTGGLASALTPIAKNPAQASIASTAAPCRFEGLIVITGEYVSPSSTRGL